MKRLLIFAVLFLAACSPAFATVSSTTTQNVYTTLGGATFAYSFKVFASADLYVAYVASDGTETEVTSGFSVTGVGTASGGNVVFAVAPTSGQKLLIRRQTVQHQNVDLVPNARLSADTLESEFDKLTFMCQDLKNKVDRTVKFKANTGAGATVPLPEPVALQYLMWNTDADALINASTGMTLANATFTNLTTTTLNSTTLSAFGLSLLDDANAAGGRSTLGLGSMSTQASGTVSISGGAITGITDLAVADGGTGSSTDATACSALGVGTEDSPTFTGAVLSGSGGLSATKLKDADGNTYFRTEATAGANADTLSMVAGGIEALTVTTAGVRSHGNGLIEGDATPGTAIRVMNFNIGNGTTASTIWITANSTLCYNELWPDINNIGKPYNGTYYTLNAAGSILVAKTATVSNGTAIATVMSARIDFTSTSVTSLYITAEIIGGNISLYFSDNTGTGVDLTTLVDSGTIGVHITYLTTG